MIDPVQRWERRTLTVILVVYLILGCVYSVITPVFEAPDESFHFWVVKHIVDRRTLPVQSQETRGHWEQEGSQPPLYYLIGAALVGWIDMSDAEALLWANPQANIGDPANPGNKNVYIHPPEQDFPWRGATLAVHLLRFWGLALGATAVSLTWAIARLVFPSPRVLALAPAAMVGFIPQFLFISASVNNDNLMTCLAMAAIYLLLRQLKVAGCELNVGAFHTTPRTQYATRFTQTLAPHTLRFVILGSVLGLACLAKLSALALLGLAGVVVALLAWHRRSWCDFWSMALWVGLPVLLIAGWWYARNLVLYGDPTGLSAMWKVVGRRDDFGQELWGEFRGLRWSFWGLFGWFSIAMPAWIYRLLDVLSLLAAAGLIVELGRWIKLGLWRGAWVSARYREPEWGAAYRPLALLILVLWLGVVFVALLRWTSLTPGTQGRLLFPALATFALLWIAGLRAWFLPRVRDVASIILTIVLLSLALAAPWAWIAPAYARPTMVVELPAGAIIQDRSLGEAIVLRGVGFEQETVRPGEAFRVNLYWQISRDLEAKDEVVVWLRLIDETGRFVGVEDAYPASGGFPISLWSVGETLTSREYVRVGEDTDAPLVARLDLSLYGDVDSRRLTEPQTIGRVKVVPRHWPKVPKAKVARFDAGSPDSVALAAFEVSPSVRRGDVLPVTLTWVVRSPPGRDYQVFVHLENAAGEVVGYGDGAPRGGLYPTSCWAAGEVVIDAHPVRVASDMPPGAYRLFIGLYNGAGRAAAYQDDGERWPSDAVLLGTVEAQ
ncbi:MAG: hypothetical protein JW934_07395 [Anaerolineae bacterium]|nr:hypothetical protein [Anaerolineae bacterium]